MPPTKSIKSAKARQPEADRPFMLANGGEPRFPEDILIAPPSLPGAAIAIAPDAGATERAAKPVRKPAARTRTGKATARPAKRARKSDKAKKARSPRKPKQAIAGKTAGTAKGPVAAAPAQGVIEAPVRLLTYAPAHSSPLPDLSDHAGSPVMPPPPIPMPMRPMQPAASLTGSMPSIGTGLSVTFHTTMKNEAPVRNLPDDREPFVPAAQDKELPRGRALTRTGDGLVTRLVAWLGKLLPRRARKSDLPRSRQRLGQTQAAVRPSEQAEIDRLRRENKRLRGEIARLAETRLDAANRAGKPPAAQNR